MRKRTGPLIVAGLLVAAGLIYFLTTYVPVSAPRPFRSDTSSSKTDAAGNRDDSSANLAGSVASDEDENPDSKEGAKSNRQGRQETTGAIEPPELDVIRDEVESDPHSTPPSMLQFARNMGKRMELALKSREKAAALFKELSGCASAEAGATAPSVKALCLSNAARLAERYPDDFMSSYRDLKENSGDDVTDLIRAMEKVE
ncbi:MAG: hypothetical protein HYW49_10045 [Deltaproteobacteria bacterium]|nr:hypothetical protein [Deltaproteobacteria bacterium]